MLRHFIKSKDSHQRVAASYIFAFGVVALCVVMMFLSIRLHLNKQKRGAELVSVSSRQRMLSERIALASICLTNAQDLQTRQSVRKLLTEARNLFDDSHRVLLCGERTDRVLGKLSPSLRSLYFGQNTAVHAMSHEMVEMVDLLVNMEPGDPAAIAIANEISNFVAQHLQAGLDTVVKQYAAEAQLRIVNTLRWESFLFVITLIVLVFQAVYIFQPILNANEKIDNAANHDPLTELPNRRRLAQQARFALAEANDNQLSIGFMHLDLDRFKAVNDTMGHGAGDELLRRVAKTLQRNLRPDQLIARVGGDEFAVLFKNVASVDELFGPAKRLIARLEQPIEINDKKCSIGCSIGLAISEPDEFDYERVLMDADIALYEAKKNGRNQFQVITEDLRGQFERKEQVTKEIREGIAKSEFVPYFQPQFDMLTGRVIGVEALARWIKKDGVFEKNAEFIQVADEIGLLSDIDQQIMRKSLAAFVCWRDQGHCVPRISLNISMRELEEPDLVETLMATVLEFELAPADVSIEILESVFLDDDNTMAVSNINALSEIGFTVELDDFGTGHAAIISLLDLSVDRIKLDRSLIRDIHRRGPSQTITRTLIQLAHELDIETLAEGVETQIQANQLRDLGCCNHQGFHYAKPMSQAELSAWMVARSAESTTVTR